MRFFEKTALWWRESLRKRRLSLQNAVDEQEEWHMHISPAGIVSAFAALVLLLFITLLVLVAYTPVLEFLPGYRTEATRSREDLAANILRLDSMERMMNDMLTYNENIALVLEGRSPVVRNVNIGDSTKVDKTLVLPNAADSALRAQMEGEGPYSLGRNASSRRSVREAIEMITPVEGIITQRFDAKQPYYGVKMAASAGAEVAAVEGGTVILSLWTPESGLVVGIQHADNLLSIYKNLSRSNVSPGERVRPGEVIGFTADNHREADNKPFEFELWSDGKAVDPEAYIVF